MKKIISVLLSTLMCCSLVLPVAGCNFSGKSGAGGSSASVETQSGGYLALSDYNVKLKIGETLSLGVKRYNEKDEEQAIKDLAFTSETPVVASVGQDGTITALYEGTTYVNVVADGVEAAVFVTVQGASAVSGLVIRFSSQKLYQGVPIQAQAFILDEGVTVATATNVTWSVEAGGALEITETGLVTPTEITDSATVKASCEYDGETYTAEMQIAVVAPIYYGFTKTSVKLASDTTVSGATNKTYNSVQMTLKKVNALSGEAVELDDTEFDFLVADEAVAAASVAEDGAITLSSKSLGKTTVKATVKESNETVAIPVEVTTPISTIADMDALAVSVYNDTSLLAGNYMLVNDIDYENDVIMPITTSTGSSATTDMQAGVQWKYRLKKTASGYAMEDRANYGKTGTGLTDDEFKNFARLHASKNLFHIPFSGTFDGNGYSIKNAAIFYGQWVTCGAKKENWFPSNSGIFGVLSGTIKNISFENITMQDPADERWASCELSEYGLNRVYTNDDKIEDNALGNLKKVGSYSLVCKSNAGAKVENVYFNFTKGLGNSNSTGTLVSWSAETTIRNCVIYMEDVKQQGRSGISGTRSDAVSVITNNLIVGHSNLHDTDVMNVLGQNGNWYIGNKKTVPAWKDLFTLEAAEGAENVRSVAEVAETFDTSVWDMSGFGADKEGRPTLIKGCSV